MSRLDELIQKLCPNGVEYRKLGELGKFFGGITGKSKDDFTDGNAKFITYKNVYDNPSLQIDVEERVKIADGEKQRTLQYGDVIFTGSSETPDECGMSSVVTVKTEENLYLNSFCFFFRFDDMNIMLPGFAKHLFRSNELRYQIGKTANGVTRYNISKKMMEKVSIPVPPLEVQREIVRILDSFTLLTAELTARKKQYEYYRDELLKPKTNIPIVRLDVQKRYAEVLDNFDAICSDLNIELPAEIEARQTQYEYYRDALLTFAETGKIIPRQTNEYNALIRLCQYVFGFVMLPLSEICNSISSGKAKTKDDIGKYPVYGSTGIIARTDNAVYNKMNILVARVGANAGYTHLAQGGYDVSDNTLIVDVKSEYSLKYIYYQLVNIGLNRYAKGGGQPLVTAGQIKEVVLPVPMKQEQDRIVGILDRFDSLCNDITTGLPAEIEARQKQYEFYRDKLLSFEQL